MLREMESTYRGLLALVAAAHDGIHGRTRAQKLAYLAGLMGASDFYRLKFQYHYYGPFSRQISDCLQSLVCSGLVEETPECVNEDRNRYIYCLTEDGRAWIDENKPEDFDKLEHIVSRLGNASITALELAATARFFQQKSKEIDEEYAFEEAIKRNPDCRKFHGEARQLLSSLE